MSHKALNDIIPGDCFAHARQLEAEVDVIRREMGRPVDGRSAVQVNGAAPRECWFAALALLRRVDRLLATTAASVGAVPHAPPASQLRPGHVLGVLDVALDGLREAKARLGIPGVTSALPVDGAKTPSDVYGVIVTVNRQLDLLLDPPTSPGEVYLQVSIASSYAARLLEQPVAEPKYEGSKRPVDCYQRLGRCFQLSKALATRAGQTTIEQAPVLAADAAVMPSDCYDLATLVLGELVFLHALKEDANPPAPFEVGAVARRWPSHVYQLTGVLEAQLTALNAR